MTETVERTFEVEQRLSTEDDFAAVPIGTNVHVPGVGRWSKTGENAWLSGTGAIRANGPNDEIGSMSWFGGVRIVSLPDAPAPEPARPRFNIGDRVRAANPSHTSNRNGTGYVAPTVFGLEGEVRNPADEHGDYFVRFETTSQWIRPEDLTLVTEPTFTVGQSGVPEEMANALPVGSRIQMRDHDNYFEKTEDGQFVFVSNGQRTGSYVPGSFAADHWVLIFLPDAAPAPEVAPVEAVTPSVDLTPIPGQQTFQQYVEHFRTVVRGAAQANSKSIEPIDQAFITMGIAQPAVAVGQQIDGGDEAFLDSLPHGTVIQCGDMLFSPLPGGWVTLVGDLEPREWAHKNMLTVLRLPRQSRQKAEWLTAVGTVEDREKIAEFNERAVEMGTQLKSDYDWCDVYEQTMEYLGLEVEPELETVTVDVTIKGTSSGYWDEEFTEILGGGVTVDNPRIEVRWTKEVEVEVEDVPEGECACDRVTEDDISYHVEDVADVEVYEIGNTSCSNC